MKYLGVDFGLKRIGLAVSEGELASSWKVITTSSFSNAVDQITQIFVKEQFDLIVLGQPEGKMGKLVGKFARILSAKGIKVELADETLSSKNAAALMVELNIPKEKRKINDAVAAAQILQNFLDKN